MNGKNIVLTIVACLALMTACIALSDESDADTHIVSTFQELAYATQDANDGDIITLAADILLDPIYSDSTNSGLEPIMIINSDITIDLNGHSISWDLSKTGSSIPYTLCIFSIDGCNVTFTGDGILDAEANYNNSYAINIINGGELTIKSGQYYGATTAIQVGEGSLYVYGGTFDLAKTIKEVAPEYAKYIINAIDGDWKTGSATIGLMGGTYGYDYNNLTETVGPLYISEGFDSINNGDGTYTIGTLGSGNQISEDNSSVSVDSDNNAVVVKVDENVEDATVSANVTVSDDSKVSLIYQGSLTTDGLAMTATQIDSENLPDVIVKDNLLSTYELYLNRGTNTGGFSLTVTISVDTPIGMVLSSAWVVFYDDDGTTQTYQATVDGSNVTFRTTHTSTYAFYGEFVAEDEGSDTPFPPILDDDDDYVPIPPIVNDDSGDDDTVTIVACAAAAVVAALIAVYLIIDRKH